MSGKWEFEFLPKEKEPKEVIVAYWLWFALGTFGGHHFYLKQYYRGLYILVLVWGPILINKFLKSIHIKEVMIISALLVGTLLLFDLITLPWQVKKYNKKYFPDYDNRFVKI